ncbi:SRPBCC family protein [Sinimarinibacterium thermocellulolyticum]|uniref:SRPBCC family protein n=1 Tax=Sinimarinibacterium thermocellulolyticum TaxID=3170016 RepID=A0ABV2ABY2_9GAMM
MKLGLILLLTILAAPSARAAQIETLTVTRVGARFGMVLDARLDVPLDDSFRVLGDFEKLPQINDAVEAVIRLDGAPPGAQRLYTRVRVCVWLFCAHLEQVQDIWPVDDGAVRGYNAAVLPELSNLRFGHARWRLHDCGGRTCLRFDAQLEPDFWVPPVIGPWAIERAMRREAIATALGIERRAAHLAAAAGTPP